MKLTCKLIVQLRQSSSIKRIQSWQNDQDTEVMTKEQHNDLKFGIIPAYNTEMHLGRNLHKKQIPDITCIDNFESIKWSKLMLNIWRCALFHFFPLPTYIITYTWSRFVKSPSRKFSINMQLPGRSYQVTSLFKVEQVYFNLQPSRRPADHKCSGATCVTWEAHGLRFSDKTQNNKTKMPSP